MHQHVVEPLDVHADPGPAPVATLPARAVDRGGELRRVVAAAQTATDALRDRLRRHVVLTDRRQQRVEVDVAQLDDDLLQLRRLPHLLHGQAFASQFGGEIVAPDLDHVDAALAAEPLTDLVARPRRHDERQPVLRRAGRLDLRREDLDVVAAVQHVVERDQPVVDLRPDAGVADLGVHGVGEVDRRRADRQRDHPTLRA